MSRRPNATSERCASGSSFSSLYTLLCLLTAPLFFVFFLFSAVSTRMWSVQDEFCAKPVNVEDLVRCLKLAHAATIKSEEERTAHTTTTNTVATHSADAASATAAT